MKKLLSDELEALLRAKIVRLRKRAAKLLDDALCLETGLEIQKAQDIARAAAEAPE